MFGWLKKYVLYAGLDCNDIDAVHRVIGLYNHRTLRVFSCCALIFFSFSLVCSILINAPGLNFKTSGYAIAVILSAIVWITNMVVVPKNYKSLYWVIPFFYAVLYGIGLFFTFAFTPDQLTITLFVLFMMVPQLFIDEPIRMITANVAAGAVFAYLCVGLDMKPLVIQNQEMISMIIFNSLGIILGVYKAKLNFQRFIFEHKADESNKQIFALQNAYWTSLADIYVSVVEIDLKEDTYTIVRANNYISSDLLAKHDHFKENVKMAMVQTTDEHCLENVLKFVDADTLVERLRGRRTITHEFLGKNFGWCRARFIAVRSKADDELRHVIYMVENINEQKSHEEHLTNMAETDSMTGLYNHKVGFMKVKESLFNKQEGMFCIIDIDRFKNVNDQYGHQTGDHVIIAVADSLKKTFRDNDILLRLGGDEFLVFTKGLRTEEMGSKIISRLFSNLDEIKIEGHDDFNISISVGAAFTDDDFNFEKLYEQADACTYQSKKIMGKSFTFHRN
ncbi:MAG: GGDEF domain-containing protein [Fibrobacteraceae bacterium]|nr:GGDEF domain-containing protein [Fibrobacteraceae bacterium]